VQHGQLVCVAALSRCCKRVRSLLRSALPHSEKHQQGGDVQRRPETSRVCVSPEVCTSLRTPARHIGGCVWGGSPCTAVAPTPCTGAERAARGCDTLGAALTPSKQTHPQHSGFTPRCPFVVLWTPCGGVEVACVRTDHQGLEKRHDVQAACEPGRGGCGGVPDHPARLQTHRTSPAQALLTILTEPC
jgi:hypothetical protein